MFKREALEASGKFLSLGCQLAVSWYLEARQPLTRSQFGIVQSGGSNPRFSTGQSCNLVV